MRLFTGLDLSPDVAAQLDRFLAAMRPTALIHWSPVVNLHITTKFIGEWPEDRLAELNREIQYISKPGPLRLALQGVGWYPNPHQPRVLFAAVQAPPELGQLAKSIDSALTPLGVAAETRAYSPHLTLARIRGTNHDLGPLRRAIAQYESMDFGTFTSPSFFLYKSVRGPTGSVYTKLSEFPLA